jgi:hypothetical protein
MEKGSDFPELFYLFLRTKCTLCLYHLKKCKKQKINYFMLQFFQVYDILFI